ncbi:hypothetical protein EFA46_009330 [Halarchaeum sp. CBA1220]|uniref:hypothetical protein n=1 Tax=Halarchaeum sp. CBA1220 TaxID=1853682 RepID=UPI000F3A8453|nr:hypothetical protein [Halarchaeum sp. CBA1220]QLC34400.1 hypothetical protein EFA46_009330 [Halarchaeum sp. CBA1220]
MRIITITCPECGTVVAANELESKRVMKCPGLDCEHVLRFDALDADAREHFLANRERYRL